MTKLLAKLTACILVTLSLSSCVHIKEYQKNKLNDAEMALG